MKLFTEIQTWLKGKDLEMAENLRNPIVSAKVAINDAKQQIDQYLSQLSKLIQSTKVLESQAAGEQDNVNKYERLAQRAGGANDENGVREALGLKANHQKQLDTLNQEITANNTLKDSISTQISEYQQKIKNAENNECRLETRIVSANTRNEIAKASAGIGSNKGLAALDDLEKETVIAESKASATEELSHMVNTQEGDSLEKKYGDSAAPSVSSDEVNKYLKKS